MLQDNLKLAGAQLEQSKSIAQEFGEAQMMPDAQKYWGHFHLAQEDYEQALLCFKEAEKSRQSGDRITEAFRRQIRAG